MNVTVCGVGYVGLVQAAVLADVGHNVCCVDVDAKKIEGLKNGIIPIFEPGLTELVRTNYEKKRLEFTTDAQQGVQHAELLFIAVGTPPDDDGSADLQYVLAVAGSIARLMDEGKIIILFNFFILILKAFTVWELFVFIFLFLLVAVHSFE